MCSPTGRSPTNADATLSFDTAALVGITGTLVLSWSLLLSQAMESVTRAFYSRSDLDLILTSPASARKVFAVRMGRIAAAAVVIAVLLAAPFVNVLAVLGGGRWLAAYGSLPLWARWRRRQRWR
jgi:ABC-2 type transport system permease protein